MTTKNCPHKFCWFYVTGNEVKRVGIEYNQEIHTRFVEGMVKRKLVLVFRKNYHFDKRNYFYYVIKSKFTII